MKMGTVFIIVGVVLIGIGIFLSIQQSKKDESTGQIVVNQTNNYITNTSNETTTNTRTTVEAVPSASRADEQTSADPKETGNDFEGYMADIFKANEIKIKQWNQGATSPEGAYAENELNPDFFVSHDFNRKPVEYWVECKYRSSLPNNGFSIQEYQRKRYTAIQGKSKRKIVIAVGVGGTAKSPDKIYIIPLDTLNRYKRIGNKYMPEFELSSPRTTFRTHISDWFLKEVFKKN